MQTNNKLREALELAKSTFETLIQFQGDEHFVKGWATLGRDAMIAALAEPVKNCEVGTAMEQGERFSAYCRAHKHPKSECLPCPLFGQTGGHCELAWAQIPYAEQEGGDK